MKIDLGDGDYAILRHPNKIPHRATLAYRSVFYRVAAAGSGVDSTLTGDELNAAAGRAMIEGGGLEAMDDLANALVLAVVSEWSFGDVTLDVLLEVPTAALKSIQSHCAGDEYVKMLQPDFNATTDADSPTGPSEP